MKKKIFCCIYFLFSLTVSCLVAQEPPVDTIVVKHYKGNNYSYNPNKLFLPGFLIASGASITSMRFLKGLDWELNDELAIERPHAQLHLDNYLMYVPVVSVYALNLAGVKGRSNLTDCSLIYLTSLIYVNVITQSAKKITHVRRPDGSNYRSFPSGHTAQAFASAEFLRIEYGQRSPWYAVSGYALAGVTGYLRMYNNKHWCSDVLAGAGVGILSTRLAYWTYAKLKPRIFPKKKTSHSFLLPAYDNGVVGMCYMKFF